MYERLSVSDLGLRIGGEEVWKNEGCTQILQGDEANMKGKTKSRPFDLL